MRKEQNPYDPPRPRARFGRVLFYIFAGALILLLVAVLFDIILTRKQGRPPSAFGYSVFLVTTDSMEPALPVGAALLVQQTEPGALAVGDVVTYQEGYDPGGKLLIDTQRISAIEDEGGRRSFRTLGDNGAGDDQLREAGDILGRVVLTMPKLGGFIAFFKTPGGIVTCIAIPLVILLLFEIINLIRLSRKPVDDPFPEEEDPRDREPSFAEAAWRKHVLLEEGEDLAGPAAPALFAPPAAGEGPAFLQDRPAAPPPRVAVPAATAAVVRPVWRSPDGASPQPPRADVRGISVDSGEDRAMSGGRPAYRWNVAAEREEIPLEQPAETIGSLSYQKPALVREDAAELYATQEFSLPGGADFPAPRTVPPAAADGDTEAAPRRGETAPDFAASLETRGRDRFKIEGIDVKVQPDALQLALDENWKGRDISITVTKEYTNVTIGSTENEVDFALFRDAADDGQKVVIQRKNK